MTNALSIRQATLIASVVGLMLPGSIVSGPEARMSPRDSVTARMQSTVQCPRDPSQAVAPCEYTGSVQLRGVYTGTYKDTTIQPMPSDLGNIDLALSLSSDSDQQVSGHIRLEQTLVFPARPEDPKVGPLLHGLFDSSTLSLESDAFSALTAGQTVTRQFTLTSTEVRNDGDNVVGTYRETITGLNPKPSTVVGTFTISRPAATPISTPEPEPSHATTPAATPQIQLLDEPTLVVDTRPDSGAHGAGEPLRGLDAADARRYTLAGQGGIPADAHGVLVDVATADHRGDTLLTVWPAGQPMPASDLNHWPIVDAVVLLRAGGAVDVVGPADADITILVSGYIS